MPKADGASAGFVARRGGYYVGFQPKPTILALYLSVKSYMSVNGNKTDVTGDVSQVQPGCRAGCVKPG